MSESLSNATDTIIEKLKDLFVPDVDILSNKAQEIKTKFGFVQSVVDTINVFEDFFGSVSQEKPPKIEIQLNKAEGGINYGDAAYALDMSWYARYKPFVDSVLSSIIWVFFVWRVFVRLPNIISGFSNGADTIEKSVRR